MRNWDVLQVQPIVGAEDLSRQRADHPVELYSHQQGTLRRWPLAWAVLDLWYSMARQFYGRTAEHNGTIHSWISWQKVQSNGRQAEPKKEFSVVLGLSKEADPKHSPCNLQSFVDWPWLWRLWFVNVAFSGLCGFQVQPGGWRDAHPPRNLDLLPLRISPW